MITITKYAYEEIFRYHQFRRSDGRGWLNSDETLTSGSVTVTDSAGAPHAEMISDDAVYNLTQIKYKLKGGTAGSAYTISIKAVSSNGQHFEDRLTLNVQ